MTHSYGHVSPWGRCELHDPIDTLPSLWGVAAVVPATSSTGGAPASLPILRRRAGGGGHLGEPQLNRAHAHGRSRHSP